MKHNISESYNNIPSDHTPEQIPENEETPIEESTEVEKPDYTRTIESFDIHNLTPENIEFMTKTIQNYFLENLPAKPELVDQIPDRIAIVNEEEYKKANIETEGRARIDISETTGFYSSKQNKIFLNGSRYNSPGELFATMFHECLHFTSIGAGAGLTGDFLCPPELDEDEALFNQVDKGLNTLVEGTTQLITLAHVIGNMGFDAQSGMFGYEPEWQVVSTIWYPFSAEERMHVYFEMPMEDLRIHIEKMFTPENEKEEINANVCNGIFTDCLSNIGLATESIAEELEKWPNGNMESILKNIRHAVGLYIVRNLETNNIELDEEKEEDLQEYLEPYKEDQDV